MFFVKNEVCSGRKCFYQAFARFLQNSESQDASEVLTETSVQFYEVRRSLSLDLDSQFERGCLSEVCKYGRGHC